MTKYDLMLGAKVRACNRRNAEVLRLMPLVLAACKPFVGQKISLATGGLSKKFNEAMEPFKVCTVQLYVSIRTTCYLRLIVKTCEGLGPGECGGAYAEVDPVLGVIESGTLSELCEFDPSSYRTDWTEEEIRGLRIMLQAARDQMSKIQNRLQDLGEHDNG